MLKIKVAVITSALLVSGAAFAGSHGVSASAPGQMYRSQGSYTNNANTTYSGASGYAPGRGSGYDNSGASTAPGAGSANAPGHY
ncbi:hypothetical protein [Rhodoblastus sp.]|uniref:hypothetical protein n=1 Tax=Rhodoblastus sp. TaxID=1962975 RepID=UPI0026372B36|nr:hypothetical protein [Rhodoblastus sp.]